MAAHTHSHFHPHFMLPLRRFAVGHPFAPDWILLTFGALVALLLWIWNS